jgi:RHS repeat-associated protein
VTWNLAVGTGTYKVYARWPQNSTHSTQAKYTVTHAAGTTDVTVNQRLDGGEWVLLGSFSLTSANSKVKLMPSADGIVAADAVKAVNTSEASRIFFVHADHLNAPRVVTNSSNQIRWRWMSDPWGQLLPETNPQSLGAFTLNLRLPGQVYDVESNLHYNYFRDYSPETGRYVQSDPIGLAGGINTYVYVNASPIDTVDPLGLAGHTKNQRESNREKHERGDTRRQRDRGNEAGDQRRGDPRKRPPDHKGPWPRVRIPGLCPLAVWDLIMEMCQESPRSDACLFLPPPPLQPCKESDEDASRDCLL